MNDVSIPRVDDLQARVDGAELLDRLLATFQRYVIFPDAHTAVAVALWVAATHAQTAWTHAPRLVISSPEKRCGKSRLLDLIAATSADVLATMNISAAALFRSIREEQPPTLLVDEADAIFSNRKGSNDYAEDLRGLINAGFGRGRPTVRCVGPAQTPTPFDTYCMVALAGIGDFAPDTVKDRAVCVTLRRRAPGEGVASFRTRRDGPALTELAADLEQWLTPLTSLLAVAEPPMPVDDREADTWEPLIAVADAAGGTWPAKSRSACRALTSAAREADAAATTGTRLLADCRDVFEAWDSSWIRSQDLVSELRELPEAPWESWGLTTSRVAHLLKPFGIRSERSRDSESRQARGYRRDQFRDSWQRYLPDAGDGSAAVTSSHLQATTVTGELT